MAGLLEMYKMMVRIRRVEEQLDQLYRDAELYGSLHLCIGQEAAVTGVCATLRREDYITCTFRGHGAALAKGTTPQALIAELMGKEGGCNRGWGGSMLIADMDVGNLGATAIVGAGIPIALGAAMSAKLSGSDRVSVAFFGDGATNQGTFHEALNMAALWKLPCVFVCENNQYAEMTPVAKHASVAHLADRSSAYAMPGLRVDGNDVEVMYRAADQAVQRARRGDGPTLLEAITYRLVGHMYGDTQPYRSKEEVESWRQRDPLHIAHARLEQQGTSSETLQRIDDEVNAEVADAVTFARQSAEPRPSEADAHVYA